MHRIASWTMTKVGSLDGYSASLMATNGANLEECLIIEIFAGSARVTAALKQLGMKSSFGVDKLHSKNAMSSVLLADLTAPKGRASG